MEDSSLRKTSKGFMKRSFISALTGHTGIAYSDTEKAETLANWLENQFQLNIISHPIYDNTRLVTRFFTNENNFDDTPTNPKPSEIITYIKKIKVRKTPGHEGITHKMTKSSHFLLSFN
ncbi:hypothetical protein TNCV_2428751 [Trichonephila clavipes]|nr:hypothetical protein TNCV_2428751 [Trichonephila clavipes]